jgi:hypothetical protein
MRDIGELEGVVQKALNRPPKLACLGHLLEMLDELSGKPSVIESQPDFDIPFLASFGEVCGRDKYITLVNNDALGMQRGSNRRIVRHATWIVVNNR